MKKKHYMTILEKAKQVLKNSEAKLSGLIADSQYSDGKIRAAVDKDVIPYLSNQKTGAEEVFRVDKSSELMVL
jgi:hypothetical protein